jgi:hypothetical protein
MLYNFPNETNSHARTQELSKYVLHQFIPTNNKTQSKEACCTTYKYIKIK